MTDNWNFMRDKPSKWDKTPEFNPIKYMALCCHTIIFSRRQGQMCYCKCGAAYVDQSIYYERGSGKLEEVKESPSE
jgi:hypothetical protein